MAATVAWQLWEAGSRSRRRRRIAFVRSHHDDQRLELEYGSANRLMLGGGSRIILLIPTRKATGAKLGRFTWFHPNFTQNSRGGTNGIFGRFWAASLAHLSFFASTKAVVTLHARCASTAHPTILEGLKPLYCVCIVWRLVRPPQADNNLTDVCPHTSTYSFSVSPYFHH